MAFKYTGDSVLGVSLTIETPKPLDNRTVVNSVSDLYSIPKEVAYQGMSVSNVGDGNIYMLIDKSQINTKEGWKASYESIQIITCTEQEYLELRNNTTDDFNPIDQEKPYLHADSYYYIYEESIEDQDQFYLSAGWGKNIENQLNKKASQDSVNNLSEELSEVSQSLANYATLEELKQKYVPKTDLNLEDPSSFLSVTLGKYYTKDQTDEIFVTKESLRGEGIEGDDFVFVTKTQYDKDQQGIREDLDKTLKTDGDGKLESITVGYIKSPIIEDSQLIVQLKPDGLYIEQEKIPKQSDIPKLVTLSSQDYEDLQDQEKLEEDTYYYIYDIEDQDLVYVTKQYLEQNYNTKTQEQIWIRDNYYSKDQVDQLLSPILSRLEALEQKINDIN